MTVKYFDETKDELKKEIVDKNIIIYFMALVSVCELTAGLENLVKEEFAMAVLCFIFAVIGLILTGFMIKVLSSRVEEKIEHLKNMHEVNKAFQDTEIKILKEMLGYSASKTLEEILKEQENGDTKECECELEQSDTMS